MHEDIEEVIRRNHTRAHVLPSSFLQHRPFNGRRPPRDWIRLARMLFMPQSGASVKPHIGLCNLHGSRPFQPSDHLKICHQQNHIPIFI